MLHSYLSEQELGARVHTALNDDAHYLSINGSKTAKPPGVYDRVLVDVPCTNDRLSLFMDKNNVFSRARTEERSELPQLQAALLTYLLLLYEPPLHFGS
jgi:16S rRNA C967 or C1407 C5-methylase (RsmB/RsmF family)